VPATLESRPIAAPKFVSAKAVTTVATTAAKGYGEVSRPAHPIEAMAVTADGKGYWLTSSTGNVYAFGDARDLGSPARATAPIVAVVDDPATSGYWLVGADGNVYPYGAPNYGDLTRFRLSKPVVGGAATADGRGYWLVASDGGVFTFGDAVFHGSTGDVRLVKPITSMTSDPTTGGYWFTASDGGIFSFDAPFHGSLGDHSLSAPVVTMAESSGGSGYWLVQRNGAVTSFGSARNYGHGSGTVAGMATARSVSGYWLFTTTGRVTAVPGPVPPPPSNPTPTPTPTPVPVPVPTVPTATMADDIWAGYGDLGQTFTGVSGTWVVDAPNCATTPNAISSEWVGLDGFGNQTVEQLGNYIQCANGVASYSAWWEMYPAYSVDLDPSEYPVDGGDTITAAVTEVASDTAVLSETDVTQHWTFTTTQSSSSDLGRFSAEWIVETPTLVSSSGSTVSNEVDFGTTSFTNCTVTVAGGASTQVNAYSNYRLTAFSGSGPTATQLTSESELGSDGKSFTVVWDNP
jgi:hypothetical protein